MKAEARRSAFRKSLAARSMHDAVRPHMTFRHYLPTAARNTPMTRPHFRATQARATHWPPHLAVVDIDLGGPRAMVVLGSIPLGGVRLPVIGLTRRGDLKTKLAAFEAGVDDILTVPFAAEELLARIIALGRRAGHRPR